MSKNGPAVIEMPQTTQAINMDAHEADKARAAERAGKAELLHRCLDPRTAAEFELRKPHYRYKVCCEWSSPNQNKAKRGRMEDPEGNESIVRQKAERTVIAQNEAEAWAHFCDAIGTWPSPKSPTMKRAITRGKQVDAAKILALSVESFNPHSGN